MFALRRSIRLTSRATRRAVTDAEKPAAPVRRSAWDGVPAGATIGRADETASVAAINHPQAFLALLGGAAAALWIGSVLCYEKSEEIAHPEMRTDIPVTAAPAEPQTGSWFRRASK
jgi:hypothetical protein